VSRRIPSQSWSVQNERAARDRDRKFNPLVLGEIHAAGDIDVVDLMKVDIDGFEYEAILGSREIFKSPRIKVLALKDTSEPFD
jgi:hypothetical protein